MAHVWIILLTLPVTSLWNLTLAEKFLTNDKIPASCLTNNVSRIFSNVIDNKNNLELNFLVPKLPLFASISINDLKKDPYLY